MIEMRGKAQVLDQRGFRRVALKVFLPVFAGGTYYLIARYMFSHPDAATGGMKFAIFVAVPSIVQSIWPFRNR
jgi:hypothetical protein